MYDRLAMAPGSRVQGPALIVEAGTSTFVSAAFDAEVDAGLGLVLTARKAPRAAARRAARPAAGAAARKGRRSS
jgi:N-methylhydantoinase A